LKKEGNMFFIIKIILVIIAFFRGYRFLPILLFAVPYIKNYAIILWIKSGTYPGFNSNYSGGMVMIAAYLAAIDYLALFVLVFIAFYPNMRR